jgi:hypothetical protein
MTKEELMRARRCVETTILNQHTVYFEDGSSESSDDVKDIILRLIDTALEPDAGVEAALDILNSREEDFINYGVATLDNYQIKTIRQALQRPAMVDEGWNYNMDEAPRDGQWLKLLGVNGKEDKAKWCDYTSNIHREIDGEWDAELGEGPFKAWKPLPAAPSKDV